MAKRTLPPETVARMKKIQPMSVGMKNVGLKVISKNIPKAFKIAGQAKKVKVNNWIGAEAKTVYKRRNPKLRITKR